MRDRWGAIAAADWRRTPCTVGRPATEADVAAGSAVFYVESGAASADFPVPSCAYQVLEDGSHLPVVIVQAELAPHGTVLGVRPLSGGSGICMSSEIRLLPDGFGFTHDV